MREFIRRESVNKHYIRLLSSHLDKKFKQNVSELVSSLFFSDNFTNFSKQNWWSGAEKGPMRFHKCNHMNRMELQGSMHGIAWNLLP